MPNYQQAKIYKLTSSNTDKVYYGSTCSSLNQRKQTHISQYKSWLNKKGPYVSSFEIVKYDNCEITLLENFPCNSSQELLKKEGEYIRNNTCVNKNKPGCIYAIPDHIIQTEKIQYSILTDRHNFYTEQSKKELRYCYYCGRQFKYRSMLSHLNNSKYCKKIRLEWREIIEFIFS